MKQFILNKKKALMGLSVALLIGSITMSFQNTGTFQQEYNYDDLVNADTVPYKKEYGHMTMKEFDMVQENLDKAKLQMSEELKGIDLSDIQKQIDASLKAVDMEKTMQTVESALKDIDMEKLMANVNTSLKAVDWDTHSGELKKALQEAKGDIEKAKIEIQKIDREKIRDDIENAKKEIEKSKVELKGSNMDKIIKEAEEGIEKAKVEMRTTKAMFDEMEKGGLVRAKDGFNIEYKDKVLYINGLQQSEQVTDKYRKYIKGDHFKITIDKE